MPDEVPDPNGLGNRVQGLPPPRSAGGCTGWNCRGSCPSPQPEFPMAHSFAPASKAADASAGPNQPDLDSDAVRQVRADLAACFRMAARYGFEEGICNHFSAL